MIRRPPRSTLSSSSAASDVYKRQPHSYPGYALPSQAQTRWADPVSQHASGEDSDYEPPRSIGYVDLTSPHARSTHPTYTNYERPSTRDHPTWHYSGSHMVPANDEYNPADPHLVTTRPYNYGLKSTCGAPTYNQQSSAQATYPSFSGSLRGPPQYSEQARLQPSTYNGTSRAQPLSGAHAPFGVPSPQRYLMRDVNHSRPEVDQLMR